MKNDWHLHSCHPVTIGSKSQSTLFKEKSSNIENDN
jgi:hypothetical protein